VTFVYGLVMVTRHPPHFGRIVKQALECFQQPGLVLLDRQNVVCLFLDDCLDRLGLAMDRIQRYDAPSDLQHVQELGYGCDLIRFVVHLVLPQY